MKRVHVVLPPASSTCIRVATKDLNKYDQLSAEEQFLFLHACEEAARRTPSGRVRFPRPKATAWIVSYESAASCIDVDIEESSSSVDFASAKRHLPWIFSMLSVLARVLMRFFS